MARSLKIKDMYIPRVKTALRRAGYTSQKDLAYNLGMSIDTIHKFLNGKPIDTLNFIEVSQKLDFNWQEIADIEERGRRPESEVIDEIPDDEIPDDEKPDDIREMLSMNYEDSLEFLAQQNVEILVNLFKSMRQQLPDTVSDQVLAELVKTALTEANKTSQSRLKANVEFTLQSKLNSGNYKTVQGVFNQRTNDLKDGRTIESKALSSSMRNLHRNNDLVIYE